MADETLMELIDAYAEARHVGGCHTYNAKTAEARAKVVASLAASAGSEPVAWPKDAADVREFVGSHFRSLFYANPTGMDPHENDVYELTAHDLLSAFRWWAELHPSPPEGAGWRDIATAPKDGTLIVLGARNGVWLGKYVPVYQSGFRPENPWSSMLLNHDHMAERYTRPTHWMPLPKAPAPPASEAKGA